MQGVYLVRSVIFLCVLTYTTGVRLDPCPSGVLEVLEYSDSFSFTCDQYNAPVTWYSSAYTPQEQPLTGTCSTSACQLHSVLSQSYFILAFLTASSSRIRLTRKATDRHDGISNIRCKDSASSVECRVDIVTNAIVPASGLTFTPTRWKVEGRVEVKSVHSTLGRYSCTGTERRQTGHVTVIPNVTLTLTPDPSDVSNTQDRRGTCSFSKRLPTDEGNYTYTVVVSPGNTARTVGSVEIVRPVMPRVSCRPSPYVPENTDVMCTCTTQSVGRPEGRLRWFRGSGNNNPINSGNYGDTSLTMTPQTLTRADHDVTTFRCDVDWVETVSGETYTAKIGPREESVVTSSPATEDITDVSGITVEPLVTSGPVTQDITDVSGTTVEPLVTSGPAAGDSTGVNVIVIVGVTALLLLLLATIIFCCWLWRRGWVMPCADTGRRLPEPMPLETDADGYLTPVGLTGERNSVPHFAAPTGPYDSLHMDDVNVRSPYAEIGYHDNQSDMPQPPLTSRRADPDYSNTRSQEEAAYENNPGSYLELI